MTEFKVAGFSVGDVITAPEAPAGISFEKKKHYMGRIVWFPAENEVNLVHVDGGMYWRTADYVAQCKLADESERAKFKECRLQMLSEKIDEHLEEIEALKKQMEKEKNL